jgi:hypothetical protein
METLIILTKVKLNEALKVILDKQNIKYEGVDENHLRIFKSSNQSIRVEFHDVCKFGDIEDEWLTSKYKEGGFNFYTLNFYDIEFTKSIVTLLDYEEMWINNDFEDTNYTLKEFIEKIRKYPKWDWRIEESNEKYR